tara:strand:- start:4021 stop:4200 length:180 start_codon:yes stop_codon:yes gene_type:complete
MDFVTFITENWGELTLAVLALLKVIVNLTPSERDNQVFGYFDVLINLIIADRKKSTNNE